MKKRLDVLDIHTKKQYFCHWWNNIPNKIRIIYTKSIFYLLKYELEK